MNVLSSDRLSADELRLLLDAADRESAGPRPTLEGLGVALVMFSQSTRTRLSTIRACALKGADLIEVDVHKTQAAYGESYADLVSMITLYNDCAVVRDARDDGNLDGWVNGHDCPIVNALTKREHPTQAIADVLTIRQEFGTPEGIHLLYTGPLNNTARSLIVTLASLGGAKIHLCSPHDLRDDESMQWLQTVASRFADRIEWFETIEDVHHRDERYNAFYACRWASMGAEPAVNNWRDLVAATRLTRRDVAERACEGAIVMHDLPAHRGEEIEGALLDDPMSRILPQARNKIYAMAACLDFALDRL